MTTRSDSLIPLAVPFPNAAPAFFPAPPMARASAGSESVPVRNPLSPNASVPVAETFRRREKWLVGERRRDFLHQRDLLP
jgi:hypothetical protein